MVKKKYELTLRYLSKTLLIYRTLQGTVNVGRATPTNDFTS